MPRCASPSSLVYYSERPLGRPQQLSLPARRLSLILKSHSHPAPSEHPIHRLPVELLALIFSYTLDSRLVELPLCRTKAPWNITQVSSIWRRVALSTPLLWSHVHFDIKSLRCLRAIDEVLRRSKNLPLTLSISWLPLTGYWVDGVLQDLLGGWNTRRRIKRLEMKMDKQVFDVIQRCFESRSWSDLRTFPALKDVRLEFIKSGPRKGYEVHQPVDINFFGGQRLKRLEIERGEGLENLAVRTSSMDLGGLTHLELKGIKETPASALGMLQASPNLTHFSVGVHTHLGWQATVNDEDSPLQEIMHPALQHLNLYIYGAQPATGLAEFLRPLSTPSLSHLKISLDMPSEERALDAGCAGYLLRCPELRRVGLIGMGEANRKLIQEYIPTIPVSVI